MPLQLELHTEDPLSQALAREYWQLDAEERFPIKVAELAERYGLRPHEVSDAVRRHATARSTETICASCGLPRPFASRADFQQRNKSYRRPDAPWVCEACAAETRERVAEERAEVASRRRSALVEHFAVPVGGEFDPERLTLEEAVALLAVVRAGADEELTRIAPLETWGARLSPSTELDRELLAVLFNERVLAIHEESRADAFEWEDDLDPARFYFFRVGWRVVDAYAAVGIGEAAAELERRFRAGDWPGTWRGGVEPLWRKLALHECLEYLRVSLNDHRLSAPTGPKTQAVLANALWDFSVGQVYSFVWRAAKDAAAYYMRGGIPRRRAANTVVGTIERLAEHAAANGWDVRGFRRDRRLPESVIVRTFAGIVTGLGEGFWETVPGTGPAARVPGAASAT